MKITRRKFLFATPLAVGAVLQFGGKGFGQMISKSGRATGNDVLSHLTWDSFVPYVQTDFVFRDKQGNAAVLALTAMNNDLPAGTKAAPGQECFTLIFTGPGKGPLTQETYAVEHFALGSFDLFITQGAVIRKARTYRAVINRYVP